MKSVSSLVITKQRWRIMCGQHIFQAYRTLDGRFCLLFISLDFEEERLNIIVEWWVHRALNPSLPHSFVHFNYLSDFWYIWSYRLRNSLNEVSVLLPWKYSLIVVAIDYYQNLTCLKDPLKYQYHPQSQHHKHDHIAEWMFRFPITFIFIRIKNIESVAKPYHLQYFNGNTYCLQLFNFH